MRRLNRDTFCAIAVLVITGVFIDASFRIRDVDYGALKPVVWPQVILALMLVLGLVYLWQSVTRGELGSASLEGGRDEGPSRDYGAGLGGWLRKYRNPLLCYLCFLILLILIPWLGMLISCVLFVLAVTTILSGVSRRDLAINASVAVGTVGGMWLVFTQALGVPLPTAFFTYAF